MKISDSSNNPANVAEKVIKDDKKVTDTSRNMFKEQIKTFGEKSYEERLQLLVGKIIEQGEKLGKKADIKELKIYKKLISEFLDEAVNNSHKFTKQNFLDKRGRHRVYAVVKTVNKELEDLTNDVLNSEKDNIKILKKLDDIRGMILDIIM